MTRLVAYLGPPVGLDALVLGPDGGLGELAASEEGRTHGDGFGVGWYDLGVRREPAVYRRDRPLWADRTLPTFADLLTTSAALAVARRARDGEPVEESWTPPFAAGPWLFALAGLAPGLRELGPGLARELSDTRLAGLGSMSTDELVFAMVLDRLDRGAGAADALRSVTEHVARRTASGLTMVLLDGERVTATVVGETLYHLRRKEALLLTSAPFESPPIGWEPVFDGTLVEADAQTTRISVL